MQPGTPGGRTHTVGRVAAEAVRALVEPEEAREGQPAVRAAEALVALGAPGFDLGAVGVDGGIDRREGQGEKGRRDHERARSMAYSSRARARFVLAASRFPSSVSAFSKASTAGPKVPRRVRTTPEVVPEQSGIGPGFEGPGERRLRLRQLAGFEQRDGEPGGSLLALGIEVEPRLVGRGGFLGPLLLHAQQAERGPDGQVVGRQAGGIGHLPLGLSAHSFLAKSTAQVLVKDRPRGRQAHGLDQLLDRALGFTREVEKNTEVVARLGRGRVDLDGPAVGERARRYGP